MSANPDFYVPTFEVKLRDRLLETDVVRDIVQVSYQDNIKEIDSFEITINNWDAEKRDFKYSDQSLFDPGKELELSMGYRGVGPLNLMIKGQITSLRPSFPSAGQPTLAISGLNIIHKFRQKEETCSYTGMTDSKIAEQVGDRLKIKVNTDPTAAAAETPYDYVFQDNQYDIIFLMERARRVGYDLYVLETKDAGGKAKSELYFGPSNNLKAATCQLSFARYRLSSGQAAADVFPLIDFKPELSTAQQVSEVTVKGWNPKTKQPISQTAKREEIKTKGVGKKGGQAEIEKSFSERKEIITDRPVSNDAEAKKLAIASLDTIAKEMVKGNGSTIGLPNLRAGGVVEMDGMGDRFSGRYFVTATTHAISDGGYTTNFECRREEIKK